MAQEFNLPGPKDPEFNSKTVSLLEQIFKNIDNPIKNFSPILTPEDNQQHGDVWFDSDSGKLKVNTPSGVKTLKYE